MATQLTLVNRVLRRLREDQVVNTTDNDYALLVAQLVADAYDEVLEEHVWSSLEHTVEVDITSGQTRYQLDAYVENGGDVRDATARLPNDSSRLLYLSHDYPQAWLWDSDSSDEYNHLTFLGRKAFEQRKNYDRDDTEDEPEFFTIYREADPTSGRRLWLEVYPEPTGATVFEARFWTRPASLAVGDTSDDDTTILIPDRPIYELALLYAYHERGEELGEPGNEAARRYNNALAAAIEDDINNSQRTDEYEWRRD